MEDDDEDEDEDAAAIQDSSEDSSIGEQNGKVRKSPISGQANTSYVRKRKKIDFSLESGDDSDEWDDGKKGKGKKNRKGRNANGRSRGSTSGSSDNEPANKTVFPREKPPRRASAARAKFVVKEFISDDDEV